VLLLLGCWQRCPQHWQQQAYPQILQQHLLLPLLLWGSVQQQRVKGAF
jgi:hypothetical protein